MRYSAVDLLDSMFSSRIPSSSPVLVPSTCGGNFISSNMLRFEDIGTTSITLVMDVNELSLNISIRYALWHRSAYDGEYPEEATQILLFPNTMFEVLALEGVNEEISKCEVQMSTVAASDLFNHVVAVRSLSPATNCSSRFNPSSVADESNNVSPCLKTGNPTDDCHSFDKDTVKMVPDCAVNCPGTSQEIILGDVEDHNNSRIKRLLPPIDVANDRDQHSQSNHVIEVISTDDESNIVKSHGNEIIPFAGRAEAGLLITPCKLETSREE